MPRTTNQTQLKWISLEYVIFKAFSTESWLFFQRKWVTSQMCFFSREHQNKHWQPYFLQTISFCGWGWFLFIFWTGINIVKSFSPILLRILCLAIRYGKENVVKPENSHWSTLHLGAGGTQISPFWLFQTHAADPVPSTSWARGSHPAGLTPVPVSWGSVKRAAEVTEVEAVLL